MTWGLKRRHIDRISELPDELLSRILSKLPTKDAAVTRAVSKKFESAFCWLTSVDLEDTPISYCLGRPHMIENLPTFVTFVESVLQALSPSQDLTRFFLRFGGDIRQHGPFFRGYECDDDCFPVLEPLRLNAWITVPLNRRIRELDLRIHINKNQQPAGDCCMQLPPELFTCESLEMLNLDSNLDLDGSRVPAIRLPNLKLLHLRSLLLCDDDFVARLVSSCPLEDLSVVRCWWKCSDVLTFSSHSLRKLVLSINQCEEFKASDVVLIDTPNVRFLSYSDTLSCRYSITNMNALDEAITEIVHDPHALADSFRIMLSLVKAVCNVRQLSLLGECTEDLGLGELKHHLPVFYSLTSLKLGRFSGTRWDKVLLEILNCSPFLEALSFPEGLVSGAPPNRHGPCELEAAEAERRCWETTQANPSCFRSHLKQIVVHSFFGLEQELELVKFLLSKTSALEELVIYWRKSYEAPKVECIKSLEDALKRLPRASSSCSIRVQR